MNFNQHDYRFTKAKRILFENDKKYVSGVMAD